MKKQLTTPVCNDTFKLFWWNFGKRTLDFSGTISDCLKSKNIKVRPVKHPHIKEPITGGIPGFRFKFELSSRKVEYNIYNSTFRDAALEAIQLFLTILGDRALITGNMIHRPINRR